MGVKVRGKNLIPYPYVDSTKTVGDTLTFTDNGDGTITVGGESQSYSSFVFQSRNAVPAGTYYLSGCPSGGSSSTYCMVVLAGMLNVFDTGSGVMFTLNKTTPVTIFIQISSAVTLSNVVFKPQLELGTTATSYAPYVPDLTAVKVSRCGKNLIRFPYQETQDITTGEFTIRINSDGTIIFNGTLSSGSSMYLGTGDYYKPNLKPGVTYILSGVPSGTLIMRATKNDGTTKYMSSGKAFVWSDNYTFSSLYILYPAGTVLENEVVKPQLEIGTTATDYESYISPTEYTPTADGTVNGVTSLYPNTTLTTDTEGVLIDCEYNRDINKAFAALEPLYSQLAELDSTTDELV